MQKLLKVIVMLAAFFMIAPIAGHAEVFRDLPRSYLFYDDIQYLTEKKIIAGYSDDTFGATQAVTRAQAAIMIGRALELNGEAQDTAFSDVTSGVTGSGYIASAAEKGLIAGYPDGTFHPHEPVTRGQMAIFLDRAFQLKDNPHSTGFSDISPNMKAYESILNISASRITFGYEDGTYRPDVTVTRGQFSAFLARALEPSFRGSPIFTVDSISGWEKGTEITKADVDTEWVITFNDRVDSRTLDENIYVIRDRDGQKHDVYPQVESSDPKSVKVQLAFRLYDMDETYTLYIKRDVQSKLGNALMEPMVIPFQTNHPDFDMTQSFEEDGVQMEVNLDQQEEKILVKVKATNTTAEAIPYVGFNGCDPGITAQLYKDTADGPVRVGSRWENRGGCTQDVPQYSLAAGKSIETVDMLYPPQQDMEHLYVKIVFNRGTSGSNSSFNPIVVSIPLQND
ncbi:S-layer homology domain-containing protein [Bacillus tuaregi]|uniref:S-layer homology domain-containing protein n=1 Tax=Bacillus tuaregi TaxID=1816695 RepID=UPI0008F8B025|nr:S-layer homology domain-containing protein [Bacillus tuaregi]